MDKKEVRTKYEQAQSHEEKIEIMKSLGEELTDEEIDDITAGKTGFCHWGKWSLAKSTRYYCRNCSYSGPAETRDCFYIVGMGEQVRCPKCKQHLEHLTADFTNFGYYST